MPQAPRHPSTDRTLTGTLVYRDPGADTYKGSSVFLGGLSHPLGDPASLLFLTGQLTGVITAAASIYSRQLRESP